MNEQLFNVRVMTWTNGTSDWQHIKATDMAHAKRIAWEKWQSTMVLPANPTPWNRKTIGFSNR
ncbi:MAG: hypothetical protein H8E05_00240 [Bacteroidetes bacterium]|nr:hypothetical protein [Bacteroidota bacterium]